MKPLPTVHKIVEDETDTVICGAYTLDVELISINWEHVSCEECLLELPEEVADYVGRLKDNIHRCDEAIATAEASKVSCEDKIRNITELLKRKLCK